MIRSRTSYQLMMSIGAIILVFFLFAGCRDRGGPRAGMGLASAAPAIGTGAPAGQAADPRFPPLPLASNGLTLRAEVPPVIAPGEDFPITAVFTYDGQGELAVLPRALGVNFASRGPQQPDYVPLPGPPKDIYPDAQLIRRGKPVRAVVSFNIARGGALWRLPEGPYDLTLRYGVGPNTRLPEGSPLAGAPAWAGAVASPPVPITVTAKKP
ncbi:MAG: hypothetical protein PHE84_10300 [bacterium]|nr:hypothetical protein [bacterium]